MMDAYAQPLPSIDANDVAKTREALLPRKHPVDGFQTPHPSPNCPSGCALAVMASVLVSR